MSTQEGVQPEEATFAGAPRKRICEWAASSQWTCRRSLLHPAIAMIEQSRWCATQ
jgi:hypothetical protein